MRIIFLVVGRMKSGPERELVDEYIKRAGPIARSLGFRGIEEVEVASGGGLDAEEILPPTSPPYVVFRSTP